MVNDSIVLIINQIFKEYIINDFWILCSFGLLECIILNTKMIKMAKNQCDKEGKEKCNFFFLNKRK